MADINALPVNRDALQKALNNVFRNIFQWLASENNQPSNTFCTGSIEPNNDDVLYMKQILYGDETDITNIQVAVDTCFSEYLNEKKNTTPSYATKKATRNGLQHILTLVGLPKIDDSDQSLLYPNTAKVLRNWGLMIKENPQEVISAAPIEADTRVGLHDIVPTSDYGSMIQFYCVVTLATGSRGCKAMHGLKSSNIRTAESTFVRGNRGTKTGRHVTITFESNKNGTLFFEAPVVCSCTNCHSPSSVTCESPSCQFAIIVKYKKRLDTAGVINCFPNFPGTVKGNFKASHQLEDSHTGPNTLADFLNRGNAMLPIEQQTVEFGKRKKLTGHSAKQSVVKFGIESNISVEDLSVTTNNDVSTLLKSYVSNNQVAIKLKNSKILADATNNLRDSMPVDTDLSKKEEFYYPDSSQSTTASEKAHAYDEMKLKKVKTKHSSSTNVYNPFPPRDSGGGGAPQSTGGGGAPIFNFYNYRP
jgi:hypothetical protein